MNSRLSSTTHFEPLKKGETRLDYYFCLGDKTLAVTCLNALSLRGKNVWLTTSMNLSSNESPKSWELLVRGNLKIINLCPLIGLGPVRSSQMRPNPGLWLVEFNSP